MPSGPTQTSCWCARWLRRAVPGMARSCQLIALSWLAARSLAVAASCPSGACPAVAGRPWPGDLHHRKASVRPGPQVWTASCGSRAAHCPCSDWSCLGSFLCLARQPSPQVSDGELRQPGPEIMRKLAGAKDKLG